jgi:Chaperone of endosialidase
MNSAIQLKRTTSTLCIPIVLLFVHSTAFAAPNRNTSFGVGALPGNLGSDNTGIGYFALNKNAVVAGNTAVGSLAMEKNTTGDFNTAFGGAALRQNSIGQNNVAVGEGAAFSVQTGSQNTVIGTEALFHGDFNTDTGSNNIAVGYQAGHNLASGSNYNIEIGNQGVAGDNGTIRVGDSNQTSTFIAGISGVGVTGVGVVVNAAGQLGVAVSSARFKNDIKPMDKASEAILALKPVSFRYKKEIDAAGTPQFGLVAEEVEKVNRDLVVCDKQGKPYTVRYEAVNAMLLNEFLKEHRKAEEQEKTIAELKSGMAALAASLKEQAAQIQKVSAQLEASKPAPQVVNNNQ